MEGFVGSDKNGFNRFRAFVAKMCVLYCLFILCLLSSSLADHGVTFPEDSTANETVQSRLGWPIIGNYLQALSMKINQHFRVPIQTEGSSTVPTMTTNRPLTFPTSLPVFNVTSSSLPFPWVTSFPTGIVTLPGSQPPNVVSEPVIDELPRCDCMPLELCVNQTTSTGITTRIVTRPPSSTSCPLGEVYCCVESTRLGCGVPNIIPGVTPVDGQANLGEFPWSAIILTRDDVYVGGGALIDANHVLTAAHKVARYGNGAGLKVRLGDWDLSRDDEPAKYLEVSISRIVIHPRFEANTLKNDISVITLSTPVATLTRPHPQINSICLPDTTTVFTGSRCRVAGWGKDQFNGNYQNIIKKVDVPVLSSSDCQTKLRNTKLGSSFVLDTNSFICAGGESGRDACTGDGGNALACLKDGHYYVTGITAGGIECGNQNVPGLYVNIANYLTWIYTQINGNAGGGVIDPRSKLI